MLLLCYAVAVLAPLLPVYGLAIPHDSLHPQYETQSIQDSAPIPLPVRERQLQEIHAKRVVTSTAIITETKAKHKRGSNEHPDTETLEKKSVSIEKQPSATSAGPTRNTGSSKVTPTTTTLETANLSPTLHYPANNPTSQPLHRPDGATVTKAKPLDWIREGKPRPTLPASYSSFAQKNSSQSTLSKSQIISIAVAVPVGSLLILISSCVFYRRRRYGAVFSTPFSRNHHYDPPMDEKHTSYESTISNYTATNTARYSYAAPQAMLGVNPSLTGPDTHALPSPHPTTQPEPQEPSSPLPPPPPPKDDKFAPAPPNPQKPPTPFRAAWRRARTNLRRSGAIKNRTSRVYPGVMDMYYEPSITFGTPTTATAPSIYTQNDNRGDQDGEQDEDQSPVDRPTTKEEEDSLTHPCFRRGSFATRVAPRTPKTPRSSAFSFGFSSSSTPAKPRTAAPRAQGYGLAQTDGGNNGAEWDNVDLRSPYHPPADLYHHIAYQIPPTQGPEAERLHEHRVEERTSKRLSQTIEPLAEEGKGPTSALLRPPSPPLRPASSVYSDYTPSHAAPAPHGPRGPSRFAERGLWIQTTPMPRAPTPARQYQEMVAWPLPSNAAPNTK